MLDTGKTTIDLKRIERSIINPRMAKLLFSARPERITARIAKILRAIRKTIERPIEAKSIISAVFIATENAGLFPT